MVSHIRDSDIIRLLLEEGDEDHENDIVFNSSDEESDEVTEENHEIDLAASEEDLMEVYADENSSDFEMDVPLSEPSGRTYEGKDGTLWHKIPARSNVRTSSENKVSLTPGVKVLARDAKTPLECFNLFVSESMLLDILLHTNVKIRRTRHGLNSSNDYAYVEICIDELKAVIGLIYLMGIYKSARQNLQDLWSNDGTGIPIFAMTMSLRRFVFIVNHLRFDDADTREERLSQDSLAPFRKLFDEFVSRCQLSYTPSENLTIVEELVPFRGRCKFRQYLPNKPGKSGIKIFALVDARTFYFLNLEIYAGEQPEGPYKVSNKPHDVVDRLVAPVSQSGRNITMDDRFTSYSTFEHLLNHHKLTVVGTMKSNNTCIPNKFKAGKRELNSSMFGFQKEMTLVSYVPKPKKNVFMLSSLHHDKEIDLQSGEKQKPAIITFYNKTKSGVDNVDKLIRSYNVSRNSRRWPLTLFFWLLNSAGINAKIIQILNCPDIKNSRRSFIKDLGLALIESHLKSRQKNTRLSTDLRKRIANRIGLQEEGPPVKKTATGVRRRCHVCPSKKDRKTQYICEMCTGHVCLDHAIFLCENCVHNKDLDNDPGNEDD